MLLATFFAVWFHLPQYARAADCIYGYDSVTIKCSVISSGEALANGSVINSITALNSVNPSSPPGISNWNITLSSNPTGAFGLANISSSENTYNADITPSSQLCSSGSSASFTLAATPKNASQCATEASFSSSVQCPVTPPVTPPPITPSPPTPGQPLPPGTPEIINEIITHPVRTAAVATAAALLAATILPAAAASVASAVLGAGGGFWNIFTGLSALFARRKKRKSGRVIEEGTGTPIIGALVELTSVKMDVNGQPVGQKTVAKTRTDRFGEYLLAAAPGYYKLDVHRPPYFMSDNASRRRDEYEANQILQIKNYEEGLVVPTIIMTLSQGAIASRANKVNFLKMLERGFFVLSYALMLLGTLIAANNIIYHYNSINLVIGIIYLLLWSFILYNSRRRRANSPWGEVYDTQSRQNIPLALVRVMTPDNQRLLRTAVTDEDGKFSATMEKASYRLVVSKPGYVMKNPVAVDTKNTQERFINKKLLMKRGFLPATSES